MEKYTDLEMRYDCLYMEPVNLFFSVLELAFTRLVMSYGVSFSINMLSALQS